jgi:hypothetical protein
MPETYEGTSSDFLPNGFWELIQAALGGVGDKDLLTRMYALADECRLKGLRLAAGFLMTRAEHAAWGDPNELQRTYELAVTDYVHALRTSERCTSSVLVATWHVIRLLSHASLRGSPSPFVTQLQSELAQRLIECFSTSEQRDNFLVRGVVIHTDLVRRFEVECPDYEVDSSTEMWIPGVLDVHLPSAFTLFLRLDDYVAAGEVIRLCPHAFSTPGLVAWKAVVRGILNPQEAPERFLEAAVAFGQDVMPDAAEMMKTLKSWSGINSQLWSPYYLSR